jgi:hypothetical protein
MDGADVAPQDSVAHNRRLLGTGGAASGRMAGRVPATMNRTPLTSAGNADAYRFTLITAWSASGVLLFIVSPLTAPAVLALTILVPLLAFWSSGQRLRQHMPAAALTALALAGIYLLINVSWSLTPGSALKSVGLLFGIAVVLHVMLTTLPRIDSRIARALGLGFLIGMAIGGAFVCFEVLSGQWSRKVAMLAFPSLSPNPSHMDLDPGGEVAVLHPHLVNRSTTALALAFWPAVLTLTAIGLTRRTRLALAAGLWLGPIAIAASNHATGKATFIGGAIVFALARLSLSAARRLVVSFWIVATLLIVPLAALAYTGGLYNADWLHSSAQHRIVIWGYTSHQVAKAPVLGSGISSARALHHPHDPNTPRAPGTDFRMTSLHSHNAYLQVWYEAGAVGALFLLALGLLIARALSRTPAEISPYLYATFAACCVLGISSFSIWQGWFMSTLAIVPVLTAIGMTLAGRNGMEAAR